MGYFGKSHYNCTTDDYKKILDALNLLFPHGIIDVQKQTKFNRSTSTFEETDKFCINVQYSIGRSLLYILPLKPLDSQKCSSEQQEFINKFMLESNTDNKSGIERTANFSFNKLEL